MVTLSPKAAAVLFSVITTTYLQDIRNEEQLEYLIQEEQLEYLIQSVRVNHSTIYRNLARQHQSISPDEEAVVDDALERLIGQLRESYGLYHADS